VAGVLVGALISGFFLVVGILVTARGQHRGWLRDRRFEAWSEALAYANEVYTLGEAEVLSKDGEHDPLAQRSMGLLGRLALLGPSTVAGTGVSMVQAALGYFAAETSDEYKRLGDDLASAIVAFVTAAGRELRAHNGQPLPYAPGHMAAG